ncbi:integral membrane protein GPR155 [Trichonephila inaurata madagascariensis]|uniref:Integral membrane protein GPR155 n=1 Tax=Trichonephila inaurata madagascariensis TaxID=2747483 RepID=A0A8X6WN06_9ARAC|nr:integral membrane protein GPR155 [Trichonephila inaurata madagascariensis]
MLLTHPHDLGKAGMFAILATQSNDFALGFPLFNALYQNTHPEYPMYLYIVAPIQLLVLNTIGFFFLESEKHTRDSSKSGKYLYHVLKGTLQNPVVVMTIIGLIWNVTYGQKVLPIFDNILKAFSSAFTATALLLVGHTMSITSEHSNFLISLQATILILAKNLIFPLILQKVSALFLHSNTIKETESYSSFGFLYGILPTAPSVYVYATQYETCIDVATKTVIGSTLFSAPLLFASASVISLSQIVGTIICVILQQIYLKRNARNMHHHPDLEHQNAHISPSTSTATCEDIEDLGRNIKYDNHPEYGTMSSSMYERVCDSRYSCSAAQRYECSSQVSRYIDDNNEIGTGLIDDEFFLKHIALLIMFGVAMTVSLFVCLWKFILEAVNGIFIELEFLDVIVNYTLGIVCFVVFGLDSKLITLLSNKFKNLTNYAPMHTSESMESQLICEQFLAHHIEKCRREIEQTKIINNKRFTAVFECSEIANWLLEAKVANSAKDAEFQIECFLKSHIIEELDENCHQKHFRFINVFSTNT